jgi:GntR family transcriptional regulator, arabinose operon transcriptional repressor
MLDFNLVKESPLPLHLQLLDELRQHIHSGALKPHDRLPGEWELVQALDISRATIQRAWQAAQEEGLIYRIAGKGTFVAEPQVAPSSNAVGFLIPEYRGAFAAQMLSGAERVLRKHGLRVSFAVTDRDPSEERRLLDALMEDGACGCIFVPSQDTAQHAAELLASLRFPAVLMDRPINGAALPCVTSNNYEGGWLATHHLLSLGHERILFVARPHLHLFPVAERYRAYGDALRSKGITPERPFLLQTQREMSSYEAYLDHDETEIQPLINLLKSKQRPTAIFAVNDWIAIKVQRAIAAAGLRQPDDLSLVGFDDLDIAQYQNPSLTTVAQNAALIGAEAARRLITMIEGDAHEGILTLIPVELIVRGSTAPPPK